MAAEKWPSRVGLMGSRAAAAFGISRDGASGASGVLSLQAASTNGTRINRRRIARRPSRQSADGRADRVKRNPPRATTDSRTTSLRRRVAAELDRLGAFHRTDCRAIADVEFDIALERKRALYRCMR